MKSPRTALILFAILAPLILVAPLCAQQNKYPFTGYVFLMTRLLCKDLGEMAARLATLLAWVICLSGCPLTAKWASRAISIPESHRCGWALFLSDFV